MKFNEKKKQLIVKIMDSVRIKTNLARNQHSSQLDQTIRNSSQLQNLSHFSTLETSKQQIYFDLFHQIYNEKSLPESNLTKPYRTCILGPETPEQKLLPFHQSINKKKSVLWRQKTGISPKLVVVVFLPFGKKKLYRPPTVLELWNKQNWQKQQIETLVV